MGTCAPNPVRAYVQFYNLDVFSSPRDSHLSSLFLLFSFSNRSTNFLALLTLSIFTNIWLVAKAHISEQSLPITLLYVYIGPRFWRTPNISTRLPFQKSLSQNHCKHPRTGPEPHSLEINLPTLLNMAMASTFDDSLFTSALTSSRNVFLANNAHLPESEREQLWGQLLISFMPHRNVLSGNTLKSLDGSGTSDSFGKRSREDVPRTIPSTLPPAKRRAVVGHTTFWSHVPSPLPLTGLT